MSEAGVQKIAKSLSFFISEFPRLTQDYLYLLYWFEYKLTPFYIAHSVARLLVGRHFDIIIIKHTRCNGDIIHTMVKLLKYKQF